MLSMIEPKEIEIEDKSYIISKIPAVEAREIVIKYGMFAFSGMKIEDYSKNEEVMYKLLSYVSVRTDNGSELRLTSKAVINNHVKSFEALIKLEKAMAEYNLSFFQEGSLLDSLKNFSQSLPQSITKT